MGISSWLFPGPQARTPHDAPPEYAVQPDSPFDYRLEYRDAGKGYGRGYFVVRNADGQALSWRTLPKSHGLESISVVGEQYHMDALQNAAFTLGRPLRLVREPDNPYDANAVAVYDAEGSLHMGYLPKDTAARIANKLDAGEDRRCFSMWEVIDEDDQRVQLRLLLLAEDASIDPTMGGPGAASQHDPHGQPLNLGFNRARRAERDVSEMLGLVKGVLADGVVTRAEAVLLGDWAAQHPAATEQWPGSVLKARLDRIFADGTVDERERRDLAELLDSIVAARLASSRARMRPRTYPSIARRRRSRGRIPCSCSRGSSRSDRELSVSGTWPSWEGSVNAESPGARTTW